MWSRFILLHVTVQFSQHHLLKRLSFIHWILSPTLSKISWPTQFWILYSIPSVYISIFVPIPYCLDDYSFVVEAKVQDCDASSLVFFFSITLAIWGLLWFHENFRIVCSSSEKNASAILIRIALNV